MSEKGYLQTKKLCVGYQKHIVVDNIEISLEQGEILTLIGPNGAGKSTVLKSIARQLETLGGSIYLDQKELSRLSGQQLSQSMAVVMTQKLRAEKMTCEDVVATGRYPYTGHFESFFVRLEGDKGSNGIGAGNTDKGILTLTKSAMDSVSASCLRVQFVRSRRF